MIRRSLIALSLGLAFSAWSVPAAAQAPTVNGIGLIDYYREPTFKVGDYVKYHITGESELGEKDDYYVTILIAGEEEWWGERCFWIETITEGKFGVGMSIAALMSYDVFRDSLAITNNKYYLRKQISGLNDTGEPVEQLTRGPAAAFKTREIRPGLEWYIDTLGTENVKLESGEWECQKILFKQGAGGSLDFGDSSRYDEVRDNRTIYRNLDVPITSLPLEAIENVVKRRSWLRGQSQDVPEVIRDRALGRAELIEFGSGMESTMVPEPRRRSIAEQRKTSKRGG